jgi:hypothetical protein
MSKNAHLGVIGFLLIVISIEYRASSIQYPAAGSQQPEAGNQYPASSIQHLAKAKHLTKGIV